MEALVAEVQYDHVSGIRFRHGTKLLRWRPDKAPRQCMLDQITGQGRDVLALAGSVRHHSVARKSSLGPKRTAKRVS